MRIPRWAKPNNWSEETKKAAAIAAKTAVTFIVCLMKDSNTRNAVYRTVVQKLPMLIK